MSATTAPAPPPAVNEKPHHGLLSGLMHPHDNTTTSTSTAPTTHQGGILPNHHNTTLDPTQPHSTLTHPAGTTANTTGTGTGGILAPGVGASAGTGTGAGVNNYGVTNHNTHGLAPITTGATATDHATHHRGPFGRNKEMGNAELGNGRERGEKRGFATGFSLVRWLKLHAVDLITMAAMGAVGLGVYEADPAPSRSFPVFNTDGAIAYPEFAYPNRKNIIPIWLAALLAFICPFVFFVLFQIRLRSIDALLGTTMGLLESLITGAVFQVFHKWLIGGLRPHFLDVCKPNVNALIQTGNGFQGIMYNRSICTGDPKDINDSLESWMSGHSTAAFAGFVYLFFYFNAQLKVMSNYRPAYWKMILTIAPLLGASLIAASLTVDEYHNWYDCVGGALTGTFCAFIAYRKTFASIWDFRFNHILLPRSTSLFHRRAVDNEFGTARFGYGMQEAALHPPVANKGGWRKGWPATAAPNDATALSMA